MLNKIRYVGLRGGKSIANMSYMPYKNDRAIAVLEFFVEGICEGRPPSHSADHMRIVWKSSTRIYQELYPNTNFDEPMYLITSTVAWLHDVADHKYVSKEPDLLPKLNKFLERFTKKYSKHLKDTEFEYLFNPTKIWDIIERISFSRESKKGDADWIDAIGEQGIQIRNIVSDADKLDAIGKRGIDRCKEYTMEKNPGIESRPKELLYEVIKHYKEKLSLLSTDYMRTEPGSRMALELDKEMVNAIFDLRSELYPDLSNDVLESALEPRVLVSDLKTFLRI